MKQSALSLTACALAVFGFAGCAQNKSPDDKPPVTTPNGPCRDDENLDNGHCTPRFPGDGVPHNENTPVPR